jgi:hypothetical protein
MEPGRLLIFAGIALVVVGAIIHFVGRLPGDFVFRGRSTTVYFPLATSLLLSLILSLVLWLINRR